MREAIRRGARHASALNKTLSVNLAQGWDFNLLRAYTATNFSLRVQQIQAKAPTDSHRHASRLPACVRPFVEVPRTTRQHPEVKCLEPGLKSHPASSSTLGV